jgi:lipopolysaccharide biosynthesis glycosyltransferase
MIINLENGIYVISIKPKKEINLIITNNEDINKQFRLRNKINYYIIINSKIKSNINIIVERVYNQIIKNENDYVEINLFNYGEPKLSKLPYEIIYSFDANYIKGAFASIYSLIKNFNKNKLSSLSLNLCIPENDFNEIDINLKKFIELNSINPNYTLILTTHDLADDVFTKTKCYKGGGHLLKLSNFIRLVVCNLIESEKLLYLDSDTIIQTDMAILLDTLVNNKYSFIGKRSKLNFNNLINVNNKNIVLDFLGKDFNLERKVIYTGTIILNTSIIRQNFNKIIELVNIHNNTKDGIYKLFTMSIINLSMADNIGYFIDICKDFVNTVDLGYKNCLEEQIEKSDVLDWSGIFKPWFCNGLYKEYWMKYNIMFDKSTEYVMYNKDTIETNLQ